MKGELIGEVRGNMTNTTIKDISPAGIRLEINDRGQVTGKYNAGHMETVSVFQRPDGTNQWETKGVQITPEGDFIVVQGWGTGKNTGPTTSQWEGELHFMTQSSRLSWLNGKKGWVEGSGDQVKGDFHGKVYEWK